MGRLRLALADGDAEYLSKLERFLIVNYPQRFELISFASREKLTACLDSTWKADILLINSEMLKDGPLTANGARLIVMTGDSAAPAPAGYDTVQKYQHADRLVADMLRLYAAGGFRDSSGSGRRRTRIICVCSPSGGTGKSSIAAGCSVLYESRGNRAFYLNLEAIPSTEMFFHSDSAQSFSNVLFHLKGREGNLGLRLEGASSMDPRTGVHFFKPPENLFEMNELTAQDATLLLDEFSRSLAYDAVFIDTGEGFGAVNTAVFKRSDVILPVLTPGQAASVKFSGFIKGMENINVLRDGQTGKIITVMNKVTGNEKITFDNSIPDEYAPMAWIGECRGLSAGDLHCALTGNTEFLSGIGSLVELLTSGSTAPTFMDGGGRIAS